MTNLPKHDAKLTYADLLAMPEDDERHEILDGRHCVSASPRLRHQRILGTLYVLLRAAVEDRGQGWVYLAPTDVELSPHDIVVPDLLVVRRENAAILRETHVDGAPDLLVEILSPSTRQRDLGIKRDRYRQNGVREYWIVDPDANSITRWDFQDGQERSTTFANEPLESVAFPGLRLETARIFTG